MVRMSTILIILQNSPYINDITHMISWPLYYTETTDINHIITKVCKVIKGKQFMERYNTIYQTFSFCLVRISFSVWVFLSKHIDFPVVVFNPPNLQMTCSGCYHYLTRKPHHTSDFVQYITTRLWQPISLNSKTKTKIR